MRPAVRFVMFLAGWMFCFWVGYEAGSQSCRDVHAHDNDALKRQIRTSSQNVRPQ
jgi:hypothetical protein